MLMDPKLKPTYLMVGALDECSKTAGDEADLRLLKKLISESLDWSANVKWLVTSRPETRLHDDFQAFAPETIHQINIQGQGHAVQAYIDHKLSKMQGNTYEPSLIEHLAIELSNRADGIFLWVALVFRELRGCTSWNVEKVLKGLPTGLFALYEKLMERINLEDGDTPQFCKNVLFACCLANRPLSADELGVCAGLPAQVPASEVVVRCGSFLGTHENDHTVYPIHQSVRDYLENSYMAKYLNDGPSQGHLEIFQRSIQKMSSILKVNVYGLPFETLSEDVEPPSEDCLASIWYSCVYWIDHLCAISSQSLRNGNFFSEAGIQSIRKLLSIAESNENSSSELIALLKDAERVVFRFRSVIEGAPLQIYGAPLLFCPNKTRIKAYFWNNRLPFIEGVYGLNHEWGPCLQDLQLPLYDSHPRGCHSHQGGWQVAISPDGKTLVGIGCGKLRLWDTATGLVKADLTTMASHAAFSADGKTMTVVGDGGEVEIWNMTNISSAASPQRTSILSWDDRGLNSDIWISHNGSSVAKSMRDAHLTIWDIGADTMKSTSQAFARITTLAYSPGGNQLAFASGDGTIQVWDAVNVTCSRVFENPGVETHAICFSPDCDWLAAVCELGTVLWDIKAGGPPNFIQKGHGHALSHCIAFSPNGRMIAASLKNSITLFDAASGTCIRTLTGHTNSIISILFSPDSRTLVTASDDSVCRVWETMAADAEEDRLGPEIYDISPDGKVIAFGTEQVVQLREIASGVFTMSLKLDSPVHAITFSPDSPSNTLATATDLCVQVWDFSAPKIKYAIEWPGVHFLAFSPDGNLLVGAAKSNGVRRQEHFTKILNVETGKWVQTLGREPWELYYAFTHDGRYLANNFYIWEIATGVVRDLQLWASLRFQFSKDDKYILSSHDSLDLRSDEHVSTSSVLRRQPQGLYHIEQGWIMKDAQRVLLLPSEDLTLPSGGRSSMDYFSVKDSLIFVNPDSAKQIIICFY
ncbi:unnamed protein product [Penicillium salamii]|uniref:Mitochondrial division protein 1 n=1 Tax=Penicillium salamii TaxID=1612424 RepID=A0A9W4NN48_9EURO|nr:unnamed protein product [Penicillium salamii]